MARDLDFTIDLSDVRAKLARFVADNPKAAAALLKDQVRLLMGTLIRFTPPDNQKQGRSAINTDLGHLVSYAFADHGGLLAIERMAAKSRDGHAHVPWRGPLMGLARDDHGNVMIPLNRIDSKGTQLAADHDRSRNRRGRVFKNKNFWITSRRVAAKILRDLYTHVGNLKKGWAAAATSVGAALPNFALKSVGGPSGLASGYAENGTGEAWMPYIIVANTTPYVRNEGYVERAMKVRQADLETKLPGQINRIIKAAGLD